MLATFAWFFLSTKGRINRQEFVLGYMGVIATFYVAYRTLRHVILPTGPIYYFPTGQSFHPDQFDYAHRRPATVALVIFMWPLIAVFVKRLHDLNVAGRWMLITFALPPICTMTGINFWIVVLAACVIFSLIPGMSGVNRFGIGPRGQR